jgi:hypothetical protein
MASTPRQALLDRSAVSPAVSPLAMTWHLVMERRQYFSMLVM